MTSRGIARTPTAADIAANLELCTHEVERLRARIAALSEEIRELLKRVQELEGDQQ